MKSGLCYSVLSMCELIMQHMTKVTVAAGFKVTCVSSWYIYNIFLCLYVIYVSRNFICFMDMTCLPRTCWQWSTSRGSKRSPMLSGLHSTFPPAIAVSRGGTVNPRKAMRLRTIRRARTCWVLWVLPMQFHWPCG